MKKAIGIIINILSLLATIAIFFTIRIHYSQYEINNMYEVPLFHNSEDFINITKDKIRNVFNLIDYKNLYEENGKINYQVKVASVYKNSEYVDITLNDIFNLSKKYGIKIDAFNNIIEKTTNISTNKIVNTYSDLIYDNSSNNIMLTEYDLCKNVLSHYNEYTKLSNEFSDANSNFSYIVRYYNNDRQKEYYNNDATLNMIFSSGSYLYVPNDKKSIKSSINLEITNEIYEKLINRIPFKDSNFYFACSIDTEYQKNDIYKSTYNMYVNKNDIYISLVRTLIISIFVLLTSFFITILIFIDSNNTNKNQYMNKVRYDRITKISHDVKSPLASIINYSDILSKEINKKEINISLVRHYADILTDKSNRLKKMIDNILLTTKIKNKYIDLNMQKIDIASLIEQMVSEYSDVFKKCDLNIKRTYSDENLYIEGDSTAMYRIFTNLFDNIAKYAMQDTDVSINAFKKGRKITISIINITANNISSSTSNLINDYTRGENNQNIDGYGLGLSIINDLTILLGGYFDIDYDIKSKRFLVLLSYNQYNGA